MNIQNIKINDINYNLHIITNFNYQTYGMLLEKQHICDTRFISNEYERLSYGALEDVESYIGFFLTNANNTVLYISSIVDLNCSGIKDESLDVTNAVEIVLLCANYNERVIKLTENLFNLLINDYIPKYKNNVSKIFLRIAKGIDNTTAFDFYLKIGFKFITKNLMEYTYHYGGKRNKIKRKKQTKHKCKMKRKVKSRKKSNINR